MGSVVSLLWFVTIIVMTKYVTLKAKLSLNLTFIGHTHIGTIYVSPFCLLIS